MRSESPKRPEDIRDAAAFVLGATGESELGEYLDNRLLRQAVERNFEIIGEALNRLRRDDPRTAGQISDTPRTVAFRNILAHGYDTIDHEIVWHLIQQDLPLLLQVVEHLLAEPGGPA
jgi:uncharacterized protein with HEPN domain